MLFQSQGFILVFLPLAVTAYYAVAGSERARQWVLIAASLVFYGWWDARFIPLVADTPYSLKGMRLGKYDKPVIHNRKLLRRIYWAEAPDPGDD